jgi:uncharacterized membrane protein YbhN (UPF0104 family)/SAM-dependent methyltransferase
MKAGRAGPVPTSTAVFPPTDASRPPAAPTLAASARSRRRTWLGRVLRYGFLLAVVVLAVLTVRDRYSQVAHGISELSAASVVGALAAVAVSLWLSMLSWRRVLADLGSPLPLSASARVFFVGQLGKYLPGSVWPVLAQMELARDHGVPRPRSGAAAVVAIGLGLVSALIVAGALLPFAVSGTGWRLLVIAGLVVSLAIASPPVLNRLLAGGLRLLRRAPMETALTARGLATATGYAVASWVTQGLAVYALALSLGSGAVLLPLSLGSYAAASALGIAVIIAPAGLGVREPAIVAALAGQLGAGGALVVALAIRLALTIADLCTGAVLAALPTQRKVRRNLEQIVSQPLVTDAVGSLPQGLRLRGREAGSIGIRQSDEGSGVARGAAPGGLALDVAKRVSERMLWGRVRLDRLRRKSRAVPSPQSPTTVLQTVKEWQDATDEARRLRLPLHHDRPKNWDALGAIAAVLAATKPQEPVLDAGSARYSPVLPWLRLYGYTDLTGINLEFGRTVRRDGVVFRHGDVTDTGLAEGSVGAVTCMSVIEHGVPVEGFLRESARILRPGGVLVVSTDFDAAPPDTTGKIAYGTAVHIFSPAEIRHLVDRAATFGLRLSGELGDLQHPQRPVHWRRQGLDYTFIRLTFERA